MSKSKQEWLLMVDGAARGNPGEAGCGAVICKENGTPVEELNRYVGYATNNVAEYEGLIMGLEALVKLGRKRIRVQSDSQLLVRQHKGEYRVKEEQLENLFQKHVDELRQVEICRVVIVPV